jgi:hypothetical protein
MAGHYEVSAVRGGPDQLVGGSTQGVRYQLSRYARVVRDDSAGRDGPLSRRQLIRLVAMAKKTERRPPARPRPRPGRRALGMAASVGGLLLVPLLWSVLADATQTRPEPPLAAQATTMVFTVQTRDGDLRLAADDLWATCRRSTAAQNDDADLTRVRGSVYVGVIRPVLPPHDVMRLRGCVEDADINRVTALSVYAVKSAAWSRAHWVKARAGVPVRSSTVPVISGGTPTV